MSIEHRPISPLRQRMIEDMRLRKLSEKTQSGYLRWVKDFARFLKRAPDTATAEDLRRYQLHLTDSGVSRISLNAAVTALRFFFEITLGRGKLMAAMSHVRVACTRWCQTRRIYHHLSESADLRRSRQRRARQAFSRWPNGCVLRSLISRKHSVNRFGKRSAAYRGRRADGGRGIVVADKKSNHL